MTTPSRTRWVGAALVLMLLAAGCSDKGGSATAKSTTSTADTSTTTVVAPPDDAQLAAAFGSGFDPLTSPDPARIELADGSAAWVVDTGPKDGVPVLFVGGTGTSATVVRLVEFLSSAREKLGVRLISLDRNGFGSQPLDETEGYGEFATRALGVMDALGVEKFSLVAISGGGPYSAAVAASAPDRIRSVHLAAAYSGDPIAGTLEQLCGLTPEARAGIAASSASDPVGWWAFPPGAPVLRIPGFSEAAVADAERTFHFADGVGDPAALIHEFNLFCTPTTTDVSRADAPVFLYYGADDTTVPGAYADQWKQRYPNIAADRRFPAVAHDVTYRHWGQVLVDLASPTEPRSLYCRQGRNEVTSENALPSGAFLDYCAWAAGR